MSRQEADRRLSDSMNIEFILDMQRKLYRWSRSNPDRRFDDLFNLVCDRRSLWRAWQPPKQRSILAGSSSESA